MLDLTNIPFLYVLTVLGALAPIVALAAYVVVDLRAVVLMRVLSLTNRKLQPGEMRISHDEWAPSVVGEV